MRGRRGSGVRKDTHKNGFIEEVEVEPTRIYRAEDAKEFFARANLDLEKIAPMVEGKFMSAFVRARKPR